MDMRMSTNATIYVIAQSFTRGSQALVVNVDEGACRTLAFGAGGAGSAVGWVNASRMPSLYSGSVEVAG
jgi:hypothetical protein